MLDAFLLWTPATQVKRKKRWQFLSSLPGRLSSAPSRRPCGLIAWANTTHARFRTVLYAAGAADHSLQLVGPAPFTGRAGPIHPKGCSMWHTETHRTVQLGQLGTETRIRVVQVCIRTHETGRLQYSGHEVFVRHLLLNFRAAQRSVRDMAFFFFFFFFLVSVHVLCVVALSWTRL